MADWTDLLQTIHKDFDLRFPIEFRTTTAAYVLDCSSYVAWLRVAQAVEVLIETGAPLPLPLRREWFAVYLKKREMTNPKQMEGEKRHDRRLGSGLPLRIPSIINSPTFSPHFPRRIRRARSLSQRSLPVTGTFVETEVGIEQILASKFLLVGRVDCLQGINGRPPRLCRIIDYKFSKNIARFEDSYSYAIARRQVSLYGLLFRTQGYNVTGLKGTIIACGFRDGFCRRPWTACRTCRHGRVFEEEFDDFALARSVVKTMEKEFANGLGTVLQRGRYPSFSSPLCPLCPFRNVCNQQLDKAVVSVVDELVSAGTPDFVERNREDARNGDESVLSRIQRGRDLQTNRSSVGKMEKHHKWKTGHLSPFFPYLNATNDKELKKQQQEEIS